MFMSGRLEGRVAIITGGTSGIGLATAQEFVREGAKVVITGRRAEVGQKAAESIGGPELIRYVQQDTSDEKGWADLFAQVIKWYGAVHVLVNSAGIAIGGDIEHLSLEDWRKTMTINLDGVFLGTKYGVINMKNQKIGASIINLSSIEGFVGDPNLAAYNASKGGVRILSKSAALYCAKNDYNLRVNTVHPGYIKTPMVSPRVAEYQAQRQQTPMGRIGEPSDIAHLCVYLASDEAKFATGAEFVVDGGYLAQ
jgi:NAD(P)-dependent dehydrogenase (short-subunit alcohol dehydrogenase family)